MPSSDTAQISTIIDLIQRINPVSILDIGCGWGKYGFLCREYLTNGIWDKNNITINAVEGYGKNISELQKQIYNKIYVCDALNYDKYLERDYDLILLIDVFEHLDYENGILLINTLIKRTKYLLISIPRFVSVQEGYSDDPYKFEEHRSFWTQKMFLNQGNCFIIPNNARKTIALYYNTNLNLKELKRFTNKRIALKFIPYVLVDIINFCKWFIKKNNPKFYIKKPKL